MTGSVEVGYYSGATKFIYPFMFISGAFMTAIFPKLAKHSAEKDKFRNIQTLAIYSLGGIGMVLSASLYLGGDIIFELFFGNKVNYPSNCICAIHRRCTITQNFDAIKHG